MRIVKPFAYLLLLVLVLAIVSYAAWPTLVAWALPKYLEQYGVTVSELRVGRPGFDSMRIESARLGIDVYVLDLRDVTLTYAWRGLLDGRLTAIEVVTFAATIGESDEPLRLAVPPLWSLVPADRVDVRALVIESTSPEARIAGAFEFDAERAQGTFGIDSPLLPTPLDARLTLAPEGGVQVSLRQRDATAAALRLDGLPDGLGSIALNGEIDLGAGTFALLAGLAGFKQASGEVRGTFEATAPWPLTEEAELSAIAAAGVFDLRVADFVEAGEGDAIAGRVSIAVGEGRVALRADAFEVRANALTFDGTRYGLEPDTVLPLTFDLALPWPVPNEGLAAALEGRIGTDLAVAVENDAADAAWSWASATASLTATLRDGAIAIDVDDGAAFEAVTRAIGEVAVEADAPLRVDLTPVFELSMREAPLTVRIPTLEVAGQRIALRGAKVNIEQLTLAGPTLSLRARGTSRTAARALPIDVDLRMDLDRVSGSFTVRATGNVTSRLLETELSGWRSDYDLDRGDVDARFAGTFHLAEDALAVDGEGGMKLSKTTLHYAETILADVDADLPFRWGAGGLTAGPAHVRIGAVDPGVAITDVEFDVRLDDESAELTTITAKLLGGRASIPVVRYDFGEATADFTVTLDEIQLADVLALEGEDIVGTGIVDGTLPVTIEGAGVVVTGGRIATRPSGGRLSYRGAFGGGGVPGLDLAMTALRNFHYDSMTADVGYALDGTLTLAVQLKGRSPDVEKGRPIHFNLNVTESIPALLQSLRAAESVTERVQRRFSR